MGDKTPVILSLLTKFAESLPGLVSSGTFVSRYFCFPRTADALRAGIGEKHCKMDSVTIPLRILDRVMVQISKALLDQKSMSELRRASMLTCINETNSTANAIRLFEARNPGYQAHRRNTVICC
jgi:hypothetical protein